MRNRLSLPAHSPRPHAHASSGWGEAPLFIRARRYPPVVIEPVIQYGVACSDTAQSHHDYTTEQEPADRVARLAPGYYQTGRGDGHAGRIEPIGRHVLPGQHRQRAASFRKCRLDDTD